jgi:hypothetical protein
MIHLVHGTCRERSFQLQGFITEAAVRYDIALLRRDVPSNSMIMILAARNRADLGDTAGAIALLDRCPASLWDDATFRALYLSWSDELEAFASNSLG